MLSRRGLHPPRGRRSASWPRRSARRDGGTARTATRSAAQNATAPTTPALARRDDAEGDAARGTRLLRQGRRVPAARHRPLPRHHPHRRPGRASHTATELGNRDLLADAIAGAAVALQVKTRHAEPIGSRVLHWGEQLDIIRPAAADGELTDNAIAGYIAKYATKAAECTGTLDRRVTPPTTSTTCPSRRTPGGSSPKPCASARCPTSNTLPHRRSGRTCSASGATSPPRAGLTPPPSARLRPRAPTTSAPSSPTSPRAFGVPRRAAFWRFNVAVRKGSGFTAPRSSYSSLMPLTCVSSEGGIWDGRRPLYVRGHRVPGSERSTDRG